MATVTISKTTYDELKKKASAYERIFGVLAEDLFAPPPARSVEKIIGEFRKSGKYREAFLKSLARGLGRSSYFTK